MKILKKTSNTLDAAFEKSKKYRGEFDETKGGGVRPFDQYFEGDINNDQNSAVMNQKRSESIGAVGAPTGKHSGLEGHNQEELTELDLKKQNSRDSPDMGG